MEGRRTERKFFPWWNSKCEIFFSLSLYTLKTTLLLGKQKELNGINTTNLRTNYKTFHSNVKLAGRKKTISFLVLD